MHGFEERLDGKWFRKIGFPSALPDFLTLVVASLSLQSIEYLLQKVLYSGSFTKEAVTTPCHPEGAVEGRLIEREWRTEGSPLHWTTALHEDLNQVPGC